MCSVRYELVFCIPEDGILRSDRCGSHQWPRRRAVTQLLGHSSEMSGLACASADTDECKASAFDRMSEYPINADHTLCFSAMAVAYSVRRKREQF
jgi:hypothetical protein